MLPTSRAVIIHLVAKAILSSMQFNMANLQRVVISVLLILTATFLFFAQSSEAAKGPKITHKVSYLMLPALRECLTQGSI